MKSPCYECPNIYNDKSTDPTCINCDLPYQYDDKLRAGSPNAKFKFVEIRKKLTPIKKWKKSTRVHKKVKKWDDNSKKLGYTNHMEAIKNLKSIYTYKELSVMIGINYTTLCNKILKLNTGSY